MFLKWLVLLSIVQLLNLCAINHGTANIYTSLGVPSNTSDSELRKAFRKKLASLHPDRARTSEEKERNSIEFKKLNAEWEIHERLKANSNSNTGFSSPNYSSADSVDEKTNIDENFWGHYEAEPPVGWLSVTQAIERASKIKDRSELKSFLKNIFEMYYTYHSNSRCNGSGQAFLFYILSQEPGEPLYDLMNKELFQELVIPLTQAYPYGQPSEYSLSYNLARSLEQFRKFSKNTIKQKVNFIRVEQFIFKILKTEKASRDTLFVLSMLSTNSSESFQLEKNVLLADLLSTVSEEQWWANELRKSLQSYLNEKRLDDVMLRERYAEVVLGIVKKAAQVENGGMPRVYMTAEEMIERSLTIKPELLQQFFTILFEKIYIDLKSWNDIDKILLYIMSKTIEGDQAFKNIFESELIQSKIGPESHDWPSLFGWLSPKSKSTFYETYVEKHKVSLFLLLLKQFDRYGSRFPRQAPILHNYSSFKSNHVVVALATNYLIFTWIKKFFDSSNRPTLRNFDSIDRNELKKLHQTLRRSLSEVGISMSKFKKMYKSKSFDITIKPNCGSLLEGHRDSQS